MGVILADALTTEIVAMPEYRYGAHKVRVRLNDGRVFSAVYVAWGKEIVKVGTSTDIPFDAADLVSVENDI
jgi:hypothetical protein